MNRSEWEIETAYIEGEAARHTVSDAFNRDPAVFSRYVRMQRASAERAGHADLAARIAECDAAPTRFLDWLSDYIDTNPEHAELCRRIAGNVRKVAGLS